MIPAPMMIGRASRRCLGLAPLPKFGAGEVSDTVDNTFMVTVISRFRVSNGMEEAVRRAFACRPHLVDNESGFCDFNVVTDAADPAIFLLITRWVDEKCFRSWHSSEAHHRSHDWMPKGIKLDPAFTMLIVGHNIADSTGDKHAVIRHGDDFPSRANLSLQIPNESSSND